MGGASYALPVEPGRPQRLAALWLSLGVLALAASGLFPILVVLSRTPYIQELIPWADFFHTALVVHVDLSVLIWFLAIAGVVWSLGSSSRGIPAAWLALSLCTLGTLLVIASPFSGEGNPLMNNYIPVLQNSVFYIGIGLVGTGFTLMILCSLLSPGRMGFTTGAQVLRLASYISVLTAASAVIALLWSAYQLMQVAPDAQPAGRAWFEYLFWGGGHLLQFTHTLLLLMVWIWLASASGMRIGLSPRLSGWLFVFCGLPVIAALPIYLQHDVLSAGHRVGFTSLMRYGGLASLLLGLPVGWAILSQRDASPESRPVRHALLASILLFAMGGVLAFMIEGINVVIPAHYHGSIVGITLSFMGLSYYLLPRLGFRAPMPRVASWQPWVYGGGQLIHILGLAWSGGYGVKRKTAGAAQGLDSLPEIAGMAMMGLGGLIAIIGGIMFIVIAISAMWPARNRS